MKYKDKNTLIISEKNSDKPDVFDYGWGYSDRERKRNNKREVDKFAKGIVCYVSKDWWECLSDSDRENIYNDYYSSKNSCIRSGITFSTPTWILKIKSEYKPDMQLYRDRMINKVLL